MNTILRFSGDAGGRPEVNMGSGRYYARFSQAERMADEGEKLFPAVWLMEAFDMMWFDQMPPDAPSTPAAREAYYNEARLYVLELKVDARASTLFGALNIIEKADAEEAEPADWFVIQAEPSGNHRSSEEDLLMTVYSNLYTAGVQTVVLALTTAPPEKSALLDQVTSTDSFPDATDKELEDAMADAAKSSIESAIVYDVGQGNAIGFCEKQGTVTAYFDLGGGVIANAFTFPLALKNFCFTNHPPIILSHWDFDHWSSAPRDPNALKMAWIAPRQQVGGIHMALMTSIAASGKLLILPSGFTSRRYGQFFLERCTGTGRNHSGLSLTLHERKNNDGNMMFFPGDARYNCIPSFSNPPNSKYLSVVAPHHGADMRNRQVPQCTAKQASRLVYSYGQSNTFSHPRHITRTDHHAMGWHDASLGATFPASKVRETAHRNPSTFGHILLGWSAFSRIPALPCRSLCQLKAQQL